MATKGRPVILAAITITVTLAYLFLIFGDPASLGAISETVSNPPETEALQ